MSFSVGLRRAEDRLLQQLAEPLPRLLHLLAAPPYLLLVDPGDQLLAVRLGELAPPLGAAKKGGCEPRVYNCPQLSLHKHMHYFINCSFTNPPFWCYRHLSSPARSLAAMASSACEASAEVRRRPRARSVASSARQAFRARCRSPSSALRCSWPMRLASCAKKVRRMSSGSASKRGSPRSLGSQIS